MKRVDRLDRAGRVPRTGRGRRARRRRRLPHHRRAAPLPRGEGARPAQGAGRDRAPRPRAPDAARSTSRRSRTSASGRRSRCRSTATSSRPKPELPEDDAAVADAVLFAHYVTLGLAYAASGRLAGSQYEPILRKCDGFLEQPLAECLPVREARAAKVVEAHRLVRRITDAAEGAGAWHEFVGAQIVSFANPLKRARKQHSLRRHVRQDDHEAPASSRSTPRRCSRARAEQPFPRRCDVTRARV